MWGKELHTYATHLNTRFNPTHVGKRGGVEEEGQALTVQPHACGEKFKCFY